MSKAVKLSPVWLSPDPAGANFCVLPCDFQPLEEELPDLLGKGEDSCQRQTCSSSPLCGEGDRKAVRWSRAFFEDKPPPAPLWLAAVECLPVSSPPSPTHRLFARASDLTPVPTSPPHRLFVRSSDSTQKNLKARNHRRGRRLPREMMELPVTSGVPSSGAAAASVAPAHRASSPPLRSLVPESQTSLSTYQALTTNSTSGSTALKQQPASIAASTADDCRSKAVQAETLKEAVNASKARFECRRRGSSARSEEWMGGARALRDSHVRLVVSQLHHIELLNRAIDGVDDYSDAFTVAPASGP